MLWQKISTIPQYLPAVCPVCRHYHREKEMLCASCRQLLVPLSIACRICRLPLSHLSDEIGLTDVCGHCIKKKPAYDQVFSTYTFVEPLRSLIHAFKYQQALYLKSFFVQLLQEALPFGYHSDCLIPVPLHPKRLRERGFNQAAILTRLLAKQLKLPYCFQLGQKVLNTSPQMSLTRQQRQDNLTHAFVIKPHSYRRITIIDDLMTTGSTAHHLALALKQQNKELMVDVCCIARVMPD